MKATISEIKRIASESCVAEIFGEATAKFYENSTNNFYYAKGTKYNYLFDNNGIVETDCPGYNAGEKESEEMNMSNKEKCDWLKLNSKPIALVKTDCPDLKENLKINEQEIVDDIKDTYASKEENEKVEMLFTSIDNEVVFTGHTWETDRFYTIRDLKEMNDFRIVYDNFSCEYEIRGTDFNLTQADIDTIGEIITNLWND